MKKLIQYLPMLLLGWCVGCAEDPAIKDIEPLTPDYELPPHCGDVREIWDVCFI